MKSNKKRGLAIVGIASVVLACFARARESVDEALAPRSRSRYYGKAD